MKKYYQLIVITVISFVLFFSVAYFIYDTKINNLTLYNMTNGKEICVADNSFSIIYLINDLDEFDKNILHLGELYKFAEYKKIPIYFVVKRKSIEDLQVILDTYDVSADIYVTNNLVYWAFSYGNEPTLLIFKKNKMITAIYGCKDWNSKDELDVIKDLII